MYCSDCPQQKQANQNPFLSLISRGRGSTHPYLCDVNASFDIFIKNGLNCRAILLTCCGLKCAVFKRKFHHFEAVTRWELVSSWRRNRALFDSLRPRRETEKLKRAFRSLRYRNGISHISGDSLSRVTQGKQRNAIVETQTIALARIVLSIGEAYSCCK